jgi:hypothetical protein
MSRTCVIAVPVYRTASGNVVKITCRGLITCDLVAIGGTLLVFAILFYPIAQELQ